MNKLFDRKDFLVKAAAIRTKYTTEAVTERMRPNPDLQVLVPFRVGLAFKGAPREQNQVGQGSRFRFRACDKSVQHFLVALCVSS